MDRRRLGRAAMALVVLAALLFGLGAFATLSADLSILALARFVLFGFMFWALAWTAQAAARNSE